MGAQVDWQHRLNQGDGADGSVMGQGDGHVGIEAEALAMVGEGVVITAANIHHRPALERMTHGPDRALGGLPHWRQHPAVQHRTGQQPKE